MLVKKEAILDVARALNKLGVVENNLDEVLEMEEVSGDDRAWVKMVVQMVAVARGALGRIMPEEDH